MNLKVHIDLFLGFSTPPSNIKSPHPPVGDLSPPAQYSKWESLTCFCSMQDLISQSICNLHNIRMLHL